MNNLIPHPKLIELLSATTHMERSTAEKFIEAFTATVSEALSSNEYVKIKGLGQFRIAHDEGGPKVTFVPDKEIADAINAPFACFEAVELAPGLTAAELESATAEPPVAPANKATENQEEKITDDIPSQTENSEEPVAAESAVVETIAETVAEELPETAEEALAEEEPETIPEEEAPAEEEPETVVETPAEEVSETVVEAPVEEKPTTVEEAPAEEEPETAKEESTEKEHETAEEVQAEEPETAEEESTEEEPETAEEAPTEEEPETTHEEEATEETQIANPSLEEEIATLEENYHRLLDQLQKQNSEEQKTPEETAPTIEYPISAEPASEETSTYEDNYQYSQEPPRYDETTTLPETAASPESLTAEEAEFSPEPLPYPNEATFAPPSTLTEADTPEETETQNPEKPAEGLDIQSPIVRQTHQSKPWFWIAIAYVAGMVIGFALGFFGHDYVRGIVQPEKGIASAVPIEENATGTDAETPDPNLDLGESIECVIEDAEEEGIAEDNTEADVNDNAAEASTEEVHEEPQTPEPAPKSTEPVYDTVQRGRYLTTMAKEHYGDKVYWVYIYLENQDKIKNPNNVMVGTRLLIPPKEKYDVSPTDEEANLKAAKIKQGQIYSKFSK